jgi:hypothetical protein
MTPDELEAHVQRELELRAEIDALISKLANGEYQTKTEKVWLNEQYRAKFRELDIHMGYITEDE